MSSARSRAQAAIPFRPPGWAGVATCVLEGNRDTLPWQAEFHLLLLTTAGHGRIEIDFIPYACRPGTLLWVRRGQELSIGRDGLVASVVSFDPGLATDVPGDGHWQLEGEDEDAVISEVTQLAVDFERYADGASDSFASDSLASGSPVVAELLRHQVSVLLLRLALLTERQPDGAEGRTFERFRRRLESGHPRSRRVEDYAEELGCSVRTLTRSCLAVAGRTAKQVVDDRVALEARRLLACTPMSVAEVGRRLGFGEPTNFGRFFHREVGMSPGQFRVDALPDGLRRIPGQRRSTD